MDIIVTIPKTSLQRHNKAHRRLLEDNMRKTLGDIFLKAMRANKSFRGVVATSTVDTDEGQYVISYSVRQGDDDIEPTSISVKVAKG